MVNSAGIFSAKPFTDYTADEFRRFVSTNLEGFIFITQLAVKQILSQGTGGSVTTITAALADNPVAGTISKPEDIAEAVVYLAEADHITGEVLHVDDGAHVGRW